MDCKMVQQKIFKFIYGEGDPHELEKIKVHLDRCGDCRREREIIEDILAKLKQTANDEEPIPAGFRDRVLSKIHAVSESDS